MIAYRVVLSEVVPGCPHLVVTSLSRGHTSCSLHGSGWGVGEMKIDERGTVNRGQMMMMMMTN